MSQARVTDFFSQRKKSAGGPTKAAKSRSGAVVSSGVNTAGINKPTYVCSSVHKEFVRVIGEAAGLKEGQTGEHMSTPPSPRTPKRTSAEAEFDLGAVVFSLTADHSSAKKRRQAEAERVAKANNPENSTRRTARKKLVLPQDSPKTESQPLHNELPQQPSALATPVDQNQVTPQSSSSSISSPQKSQVHSQTSRRQSNKALSKKDITALKSRLQKIRKQAEAISTTTPTSSSSSSAAAVPKNPQTPVPEAATPPSSDRQTLKTTVVRAKELAAKAQRRKEEREAEESRQSESETETPDSAEQPTYQRYHTLAQAGPPSLSLPFQYKVLAEMFRSMDTVVAMLYNRSETVTFMKIKHGVQDMMHKRFEESHLGQIKTVFPQAYTFRQEKNIPTFNSSIKKGSYQLTVEPLLHSDKNEAHPVLTASRLLERRHIFHSNLVSIVKQHHKVFLSSLVPPLSVPEDKLTRWHPRFNVDTVPAISLSLLPQPPHTEKLATAQEVLDKARLLITPKMERALVSMALKTEEKATDSKDPPLPQTATESPTSSLAPPAAQTPAALKGVSQSLLDRIRAKEAQKLQATMTRNPAQDVRLLMMSRLGELARILRTVFVAEKKPALIMEVACNRMVSSYRSALSTGEMEKHLRLLAEVVPDWLTILPIRKDFYLRLNKTMELSTVLDKLTCRLKEEERL